MVRHGEIDRTAIERDGLADAIAFEGKIQIGRRQRRIVDRQREGAVRIRREDGIGRVAIEEADALPDDEVITSIRLME